MKHSTGRKSWGRVKQGDSRLGVSTRPSKIRRQISPLQKRCVAASFLAITLCPFTLPTHAAARLDIPQTPEITASIAHDTAHEVAIRPVDIGQEQLTLSARLTTTSGSLAKDIAWQIRDIEGALIWESTTTELVKSLAPGEYSIEAQYGAVSLRESVILPQGSAIEVSFVLNAGGLRVLSGLKGLTAALLPSQTLVYALTGIQRGKLVAHSKQPGEILKLAAGQYRIESRYGEGNTSATTDVRIRPGKISAVEVKHQAGLARLSFVGAPDATVTWDVRTVDGLSLGKFEGITNQLALKPGVYFAEAHVNGEVLSAKFQINSGEERDILLGN